MGCRRRDQWKHERSEHAYSRRRLYRDPSNGWLAGVCAGVSDYLGISRGFVRLVLFLLAFPFTLTVVGIYVILAIVLKRRPQSLYGDAAEEQFWRSVRVEPSRTTGDLAHKFEAIERRLRDAEARVTSSTFRLRRAFRDLENGGRAV